VQRKPARLGQGYSTALQREADLRRQHPVGVISAAVFPFCHRLTQPQRNWPGAFARGVGRKSGLTHSWLWQDRAVPSGQARRG